MRTNKLALVLVSLFTISLGGCLTEQDIDDEQQPHDDIVRDNEDDDSSDDSPDHNCRQRRDTGEFECPDPE